MFRESRATAPQTYHQFRTSNGAGDVLYVLLNSLTALGLQALFFEEQKCRRVPKHGAHFAVDKLSQIARAKKKTKTAADERQLLRGPSVSPQTCDKSFFGFLEVNFDERTKS